MTESQWTDKLLKMSQNTGYSGNGDDASPLGTHWLSSDQFIENTHFKTQWMSFEEIGYKSVVQALSDLAAMATSPQGLMASLAWPPHLEKESILKLLQGIESACLDHGTPLMGGDISSAPQIYINHTVVGGRKDDAQALSISGASPEQKIVISGPLGYAATGLYEVTNKIPTPRYRNYWTKPEVQFEKAEALQKIFHATALTDMSDSLCKSLHGLTTVSHCGALIMEDKLLLNQTWRQYVETLRLSALELFLHGGEDYQLLATVPAEVSDTDLLAHGLMSIGVTTKAQKVQLQQSETRSDLPLKSWDPFALAQE